MNVRQFGCDVAMIGRKQPLRCVLTLNNARYISTSDRNTSFVLVLQVLIAIAP